MKKLLVIFISVLLALTANLSVFAAYELEDFTIPETGILFQFNGNADDAFGNISGSIVGDPQFVEGRDNVQNGAIYFDSPDQHVALLKNDIPGDWTASFWVKQTELPNYSFLCTSIKGSLRLNQLNTGTVGATINDVVDNSTAYEVELDKWTMLTFVHVADDASTHVYADGEYIDSMFGELALPFTLLGNESAELKGWQIAPMYAMDDVWFFGRALSEEEVLNLYKTNSVDGKGLTPEQSEDSEPVVDETPEAAVEIPAADAAESKPVAAPQTSDMTAGLAAVASLCAAAIIYLRKGARKQSA